MKLEFLDRFSINNKILKPIKISPMGAELLHADRQADIQAGGHTGRRTYRKADIRQAERYDKANSHIL
jgi:hypothetical protein